MSDSPPLGSSTASWPTQVRDEVRTQERTSGSVGPNLPQPNEVSLTRKNQDYSSGLSCLHTVAYRVNQYRKYWVLAERITTS